MLGADIAEGRVRIPFSSSYFFSSFVLTPPSRRIRGREIEDALSLAPRHETSYFASRHYYDMVVVYDRSSTSFPTAPPSSTSSDAQRVLWNLWTAIYEREFTKPLKRQPVLLAGGWEAWEKQVGPEGIVGSAVAEASPARPRPQRQNSDTKHAHRKATVLPSVNEGGSSVLTNGSSRVRLLAPFFSSLAAHAFLLLTARTFHIRRSTARSRWLLPSESECRRSIPSSRHASRRRTTLRPRTNLRPLRRRPSASHFPPLVYSTSTRWLLFPFLFVSRHPSNSK
jgi:hypothetical protein